MSLVNLYTSKVVTYWAPTGGNIAWLKSYHIISFQRRRSTEDEQMMRKYLCEGDLISAEVQAIFSDGSLSLHTRSLKYGRVISF